MDTFFLKCSDQLFYLMHRSSMDIWINLTTETQIHFSLTILKWQTFGKIKTEKWQRCSLKVVVDRPNMLVWKSFLCLDFPFRALSMITGVSTCDITLKKNGLLPIPTDKINLVIIFHYMDAPMFKPDIRSELLGSPHSYRLNMSLGNSVKHSKRLKFITRTCLLQ